MRPINFLGGDSVTATEAHAQLTALARFDTPTICNALELVVPERRARGFNRRPLVAPIAGVKPMVGYARTVTIRSREPHPRDKAAAREMRLKYYAYIADAPLPSVCVMQDVDGPDAGFGCFWGEVQSNLHQALGCAGVVTDGSVRDIDAWAPGFFVLAGSVMPSHAHVDIVDFGGTVSVAGMVVSSNDIIHADRHGAVVVPCAALDKLPAAAETLARRERVVLEACRAPGFKAADLAAIFARMDEIH
jgi:regulator of RNase E activity RraA